MRKYVWNIAMIVHEYICFSYILVSPDLHAELETAFPSGDVVGITSDTPYIVALYDLT